MVSSSVLISAALVGVVGPAAILLLLLPRHRRRRRKNKLGISDRGAELVGKARYRGKRIYHYGDGTVKAETRFGVKSVGSFDAYRSYADRR